MADTLKYPTNYNGPNAVNSGRYMGGKNITVGPSGFKSGTVGYAGAVYATTGSFDAVKRAMGSASTTAPKAAMPPAHTAITETHTASVSTPVNNAISDVTASVEAFASKHPVATAIGAAAIGAGIGAVGTKIYDNFKGGKSMGIFGSSSSSGKRKRHSQSPQALAKKLMVLKLKRKIAKEQLKY